MEKLRFILFICLAALWSLQGFDAYAQKVDSPQNYVNAIDHRYQTFGDGLPQFADSVKFRDRFYTIFGGGYQANWQRYIYTGDRRSGFDARLSFGYRLTPVHAVETDFQYSNFLGEHGGALNFNYVMNLNNIAKRSDGYNKLEALFVSGISFRYDHKFSAGASTGIRLQWNPGINAGFFIEPKLNVMASRDPAYNVAAIPSINVGFTLRYQKPKYYLWDYLTPFAIKTNLLYDAASALNIGIEAPIGKRYSVAVDWTAPWWSSYNKQIYIQMLLGSVEGRYWFGDREKKELLTGFFAGASIQGGLYDFMFDPIEGIQGELQAYSAVGGYAHTINKAGNLRMEYSLGIGYMRTRYVKYWWDGFDYTLIAPSPQTWVTNWFGPTKVSVSLVYMLKLRSKVGGRP